MYKFTAHLNNSHLYLIRKNVNNGKCAMLVVRAFSSSKSCLNEQKCLPPHPPKKSRKLLYGTIATVVLTGAAVTYAKYSPPTRKWLDVNMPFASTFVGIVWQEQSSYYDFTLENWNKAKDFMHGLLFGKEGVTPPNYPIRPTQDLEEDAKKAFASKTYKLPCPVLAPLYVPKFVLPIPEIDTPSTVVKTGECEPKPGVKVNVTQEMVELEQQMFENTKIAVEQYKDALNACKKYNETLYKVIELPIDALSPRVMNELKAWRSERDNLHAKAAHATTQAKCAIETLTRIIKAGADLPPEQAAVLKRYITQFRDDVTNAEEAYQKEAENSILSTKYWDKVKEARDVYKSELNALFPELDLSAKQLHINDTDLLLMYTLKQVQYLQNQLAESQTIRELKLNRAIDCQDEKGIIQSKVDDMVTKEKLAKELEYQKKEMVIIANAKKKLDEEMKKQYIASQEALAAMVEKREKEAMGNLNKKVSEILENERIAFKKELAEMAGRLKAIEATLKNRAAVEAEARRSLSMWAAAEALLAATRKQQCRVNIEEEVKALEKAGSHDAMVKQVLKGIREDTKKNGIVTEKNLVDKFDQLEKTAYKVALIGREGASLPMYFLSWLQSMFLFHSLAEIPQDELNDRPVDFTKLDTFDIIQRARYYVDHGNLSHAVRYVNLLQGAPRAAALPWLRDVREHLEVRQAALTVMAHASLAAMQNKK